MLDIIDHGRIREVRLDRPPANALNQTVFETLEQVLCEAGITSDAVVVSGRPGMFSAGLDVPELLQLDRAAFTRMQMSFLIALKTIATMPVPTAFALTGHAPAGGIVMAVFADYRIMAGGPYKTGFNEVQVGLNVPTVVQGALRRMMSAHRAERILVSGEIMEAERAAAIGLVDELADSPEDAVTRALLWCHEQLALPSDTMLKMRARSRTDLHAMFDHDLEKEAAFFTDMWFSRATQDILTELANRLGN